MTHTLRLINKANHIPGINFNKVQTDLCNMCFSIVLKLKDPTIPEEEKDDKQKHKNNIKVSAPSKFGRRTARTKTPAPAPAAAAAKQPAKKVAKYSSISNALSTL